MIEVNYNEYKETIAQNMKLIVENHDLKQEIERLNNTIKEVREYIELGMNFDSLGVARTKKKLLDILNKGE